MGSLTTSSILQNFYEKVLQCLNRVGECPVGYFVTNRESDCVSLDTSFMANRKRFVNIEDYTFKIVKKLNLCTFFNFGSILNLMFLLYLNDFDIIITGTSLKR